MSADSPHVALLIGASRGIGAAAAHAFSAQGARVFLSARDDAKLEGVRAAVAGRGGTVAAKAADVADADAVQAVADAAMQEYGRIDTVVNFAALTGPLDRASWELEPDDWRKVLAINTTGPFNIMRAVMPVMQRQNSGSLIFASSPFGDTVTPGMGAYAASRAAAHALVRQLAAELETTGVGACLAYPGMTETDGLSEFRRARGGAAMGGAQTVSAPVMANLFVWAAQQAPWQINGAVLAWSDPQVRNAVMAMSGRG